MTAKPEFSRTIEVAKLPETGGQEEFEATEAERLAVRDRLGLAGLERLQVKVSLVPWKRGGIRVRGTVSAEIAQQCVVSLDIFSQTIEVPLDRLFVAGPQVSQTVEREVVVAPEDEDIGVIEDGLIEVGEFAVEELALALDPYPRKPGVEFSSYTESGNAARNNLEDGGESPFAVLKSMFKDKRH
jgi:uncharacterized metal-binding protein YceD (DUF177 family)